MPPITAMQTVKTALFITLIVTLAIVAGCASSIDTQATPQTSDQGHWVSVAPTVNVFIGSDQSSTNAMPGDTATSPAVPASVQAGTPGTPGAAPAGSATVGPVSFTTSVTVTGSTSGGQGASPGTGAKSPDVKPAFDVPINVTPGSGAKIGGG